MYMFNEHHSQQMQMLCIKLKMLFCSASAYVLLFIFFNKLFQM